MVRLAFLAAQVSRSKSVHSLGVRALRVRSERRLKDENDKENSVCNVSLNVEYQCGCGA